MSLNLVLPVLNGEKASSKDVIVSLLAFEQKLTAKKIHSISKRKFGLEVSYQAVHKTLNELCEEKIIQKKGKEYELNLEWIKSLKKFTEEILSGKNNPVTVLQAINAETTNLYFEDLASVDRFLLSAGEAIITKERKPLYYYWFHSWTPLFFSKEGYGKMQALAEKTDLFVLIKGNSVLDKWCGQVLKKFNQKNFKLGVKNMHIPEFLVYSDFVFQVFYPKKIIEKVNLEFKKIKKIEDLDINKLFAEVFEKKTGIPVILTKNKILADQLKEKVRNYF